jgi:hypothetical protein
VSALALQRDGDDEIRLGCRRSGYWHGVEHPAVHKESTVDGHRRDDPWYADRRSDGPIQGACIQPHLAAGQQIDSDGCEADR